MNNRNGVQGEGAWGILAEATLKAAVAISVDKGVYEQVKADPGGLSAAMKAVLTEAIPAVRKEWADATKAHFPESFLRSLVNVQANQYGIEALKQMGVWPDDVPDCSPSCPLTGRNEVRGAEPRCWEAECPAMDSGKFA